ncbi:TetR/AcrR family transcriptional regulator [Actinomadura rayongensis]|uniref:TetR family transcriptional regulator n=1 Tax=Actinomadura rayongensis TaxID=1429076 RepID=A0A6I4WF65_9ACTN|nr:TetR/AcrR family transcriptional regulator [Actinomadura rayongensis]MXQ67530.1 TetR family transcriptional regulator [Actinomadura rayongensis]
MAEAAVGRRERKKARTKQAIADAALDLFLEHGFDEVTVKDVAEAADVSMSGLFKHFPTKESLVFDEDADLRPALVSAVRDHRDGTPVLRSLQDFLADYFGESAADPRMAGVLRLVATTPALNVYARRRWLRHERALTQAIQDAGPQAPGAEEAARAVARFVLESLPSWQPDDLHDEVDAAFSLLREGWQAPEPRRDGPIPATDPECAQAALGGGTARAPGLRERKKAQTRRAITRTALELFTEHGYDEVGVRQIAEAAGVSPATLFIYFPDGKASLIFPGDRTDRAANLVHAVRHRAPGRTILRSLHDHMAQRGPFKPDPTPDEQRVLDLVRGTPELADYVLQSWRTAQDAVTEVIAEECGLPADDPGARLLTRYVLQIPDLASTSGDARLTLDVVTRLLEQGWPRCLIEPSQR